MHGAAGLTRHRKSTFHSEGKMNKMRSRSAASEENVKTPGKYGRFRKHRVLWVTRSVLWNTGSGSPSGQEPRARTTGKVAAAIPARIADGNRRDALPRESQRQAIACVALQEMIGTCRGSRP